MTLDEESNLFEDTFKMVSAKNLSLESSIVCKNFMQSLFLTILVAELLYDSLFHQKVTERLYSAPFNLLVLNSFS